MLLFEKTGFKSACVCVLKFFPFLLMFLLLERSSRRSDPRRTRQLCRVFPALQPEPPLLQRASLSGMKYQNAVFIALVRSSVLFCVARLSTTYH